ncbi:unnamed protein product [Paramecium sonneborni]|uniref:Uncharacterized protein n=1 Tax=Paramecium sonneborni TaxID=65129 RepID=A0A8S1Q8E7_9CILI|nr:unnamed protein product [Paramecium sonneborni]
MMNQFVSTIDQLLVISEEYKYNYQPNAYVNVKLLQNPLNNTYQGLLFSESFQIEQLSQSYIEVSDIQEHIYEACRFFGYFYGIFTIQSNKPSMELLNNTFQGNHTFQLTFSNQPITESLFSSKYYLKLVTTNSIDI